MPCSLRHAGGSRKSLQPSPLFTVSGNPIQMFFVPWNPNIAILRCEGGRTRRFFAGYIKPAPDAAPLQAVGGAALVLNADLRGQKPILAEPIGGCQRFCQRISAFQKTELSNSMSPPAEPWVCQCNQPPSALSDSGSRQEARRPLLQIAWQAAILTNTLQHSLRQGGPS